MTTNPTTTLDERFGEPGVAPTDWAAVQAALEAAELYWITTVRADGRPHVTPLIGVWTDGAMYFCTGADEQKAVNLRTNAQVALTTGANTWADGLDVVVEGAAERVTDEAALTDLARAWEDKYGAVWHFDVRDGAFHAGDGGVALVFRVPPAKVIGFGKSPHNQTRFTFPG
jgi:general stress protein 26